MKGQGSQTPVWLLRRKGLIMDIQAKIEEIVAKSSRIHRLQPNSPKSLSRLWKAFWASTCG
jgi:hypothetical protein